MYLESVQYMLCPYYERPEPEMTAHFDDHFPDKVDIVGPFLDHH